MDAGLILPLLDGLDEVAPDHREACVETINTFINEHGLLPLVVCSRVADYKALSVRLRVPSAVLIQALRRQQVQNYVDQAGAALAGLHTALQHDESLWELLNTPLMLSIAAFAYQGRSVDEIPALGTGEAHRAQLFAAYTDAMFHRRARTTPYPREQTEHWLTWLARAMKAHNQSIFYVERMQPNWVTEPKQHRSIRYILHLMGSMLSGVLFIGLYSVVGFERRIIWLWGLVGGGGMYLLFRLWAKWKPSKFTPILAEEIKCVEKIWWSWSAVSVRRKRLILFGSLTAGLLSGLGAGLRTGLGFGLFYGLLTGLPIGLRYGGGACLHHYALRLVLWYNNFAPLHYIRFLDYAAARIFLRKVGGGYVFVHRLLLEYFAGMPHTSAEPHNCNTHG